MSMAVCVSEPVRPLFLLTISFLKYSCRMLVGCVGVAVNLRCQNKQGETYDAQILRDGRQGTDVDALVNKLKHEACEAAKNLHKQLNELQTSKTHSNRSRKEFEDACNKEKMLLEAEISALRHEVQNAAKEKKEVMTKLRAEKSLNTSKKEVHIKCLNQLAATVHEFVSDIRFRLAEVGQDAAKMQGAQDVIKEELTNFSRAFLDLQSDHARLGIDHADSTRTIEALTRQNGVLVEKLSTCQVKIKEQSELMETLQAQHTNVSADLESLDKAHNRLIPDLDEAQVKTKELEAALAEKKWQADKCAVDIKQFAVENERLSQSLKRAMHKSDASTAKVESLEKKLQDALREAEDCKQKMAQDRVQSEAIAAELAVAQAHLVQKRKEVNALHVESNSLHLEAKRMTIQMAREAKRADDAIAHRKRLEDECADLFAKLKSTVRAGELMHAAVCRPILGGPSGLGIVLDVNSTAQVIVAEILGGGPASNAGLKTGVLVEIDQQAVAGMTREAAEKMLVGQVGKKVQLKIQGDPKAVELTRERTHKSSNDAIDNLQDHLTPETTEAAEKMHHNLHAASCARDDAEAKSAASHIMWDKQRGELMSEVDSAKRQIETLKTQIQVIKEDAMEKEVERTKEIDVLRTEIAAEKKAKSAADNELDKVQTHNCAMAMELGELKAMLQSLEESSGSDAPTDPRKLIADREKELADVKRAQEKLQGQMHSMASQLDEALVHQTKLREDLSSSCQALEKVRTDHNASLAEIEALKGEADALKEAAQARSLEIQDQARMIAGLESERDSAIQRADAEAQTSQSVNEERRKIDAELHAKRAEMEGLFEKLTALAEQAKKAELERDQIFADWKESQKIAEAEVQDLQRRQASAESAVKQLVDAGERMHASVCLPLVAGPAGLGIIMTSTKDGNTAVSEILEGPAQGTNINQGDVFVEIDGKNVASLSSKEVDKLLVGPIGRTVRLKMQPTDGGKPYVAELLRQRGIEKDPFSRLPGLLSVSPEAVKAAGKLHEELARFKAKSEETKSLLDEQKKKHEFERGEMMDKIAQHKKERDKLASDVMGM